MSKMKKDRFSLRPFIFTLIGILSLSCSHQAMASCLGMDVQAERGAPDAPENSLSGVQTALTGGWDGVQINMLALDDNNWVMTHDWQLGRVSSLNRSVEGMRSPEWREIRLKNRQGRLTNEPAAIVDEMLSAMMSRPDKVINAEIMNARNDCRQVNELIDIFKARRPSGNWFITASDVTTLRCLRQADPGGYVGVTIADPLEEVAAGKWSQHSFQPGFTPGRGRMALLTQSTLQTIQETVGMPVGLHVQINTVQNNPGLLRLAKSMNMPVYTQDFRGDDDHIRALNALWQSEGLLPSGVVIKGQADHFCSKLVNH